MHKVHDSDGIEIDGVAVIYCRVEPVADINSGRTLGGLWYSQSVGATAYMAKVQLKAIGLVARDKILNAFSMSESLSIGYDGIRHIGFISKKPTSKPIRKGNKSYRTFAMDFEFSIDETIEGEWI